MASAAWPGAITTLWSNRDPSGDRRIDRRSRHRPPARSPHRGGL